MAHTHETNKPTVTLERIEADYVMETSADPRRVAAVMAGEQSSGTFVSLPTETPELIERSAARVELVEPLRSAPQPTEGNRAKVTLSWPIDNLGPSLPNLMATVAGNLFELSEVDSLKVMDIRLPKAFADEYPGPRFSIEGTRRLTGVEGRPLIGTIVKPSVGLSPKETADLVAELCKAGIDFIKDDELQSDSPTNRFDDRVKSVMGAINDHAEATGKKVMFAFNITGDLSQMKSRHDTVVRHSGTCVMISLNSVGLAGMIELGRFSVLPIHAHRNGWGYLSRGTTASWSYVAWQKIWRLAGADHMHVNGLDSKFTEDNESVIASAQACLTPMFESKPCLAMPVFSSGQTVRQASATYEALGSSDLIYAAGGGVMGHPDGPTAGVRSLQEAWEAAIAGIPIDEHARDHPALAQALAAF